MMLMNRAPGVR